MHGLKCLECMNTAEWRIQLIKPRSSESKVNFISCEEHRDKFIQEAKDLQRPLPSGDESPFRSCVITISPF